MRILLRYFPWEDYQLSRTFIENASVKLMNHENKGHAKVGFPWQNYICFTEGGTTYYLVRTNVFMHLIDSMLYEAKDKFPERFGTGNADDVLEALYYHYPFGELNWFKDFLKDDQFCYAIAQRNGQFDSLILRIDLFRKLEENANGGRDFTGGLFHALKHFSHEGIPLSIGTDINNISHINELLADITVGFFTTPHVHEKKDNYIVIVPISEEYQLRVSVFLEKATGIYFINTVFKEKRPL